MHDTWNPNQYEQFRAERSQPFFDLLAMVEPREQMRIIDLGCGTGELTNVLHEKLHARETLGIDNSDNMLERTREVGRGLQSAGLRFEKSDLSTFTSKDRLDLIFSNAAIQWTADHHALLSRLTQLLVDDGQIAIQIPANDDHVTHEAARIVARQEPFRSVLNGWTRARAVLAPEDYATILHKLGYASQHVRLQVYPHVLESRDAVVEWVRGTLLTDYQKRIPPELWENFLEAYRQELFRALPDDRPFFYPFKRILFWGKRTK